ncbi:MAG: DUF1365 domain-containing protein [Pseudomonadota bacterium]|jgi:DUF1365 family protein
MQSTLQPGSVFHQRIFPFNHKFSYKTLSALIDLDELENINKLFFFSINKFNLLSFNYKDHGNRREDINPKDFIKKNILKKFKDKNNYKIYIYCTPSFLGYVFNPISIYLCKNNKNEIKYICYEVKNTHHEQHCYFLKIKKRSLKIHSKLNKKFYVSPFLEMDLKYKFYLLNNNKQFLLNIDVYKKNQIMLKTGISSSGIELNNISLILNVIKNLFYAQKIMIFIHYQAIKIFKKQKSFFSKPPKKNDTISFHV